MLRDICADAPADDLAGLCGLSRSYFIKAFKVSMGTPPHRWLVSQRIGRALALLEDTNEGISAIALACGFSDQSHLTRAFHAAVGTSPGAWRRQRRAGVPFTMPPVAVIPFESDGAALWSQAGSGSPPDRRPASLRPPGGGVAGGC